MTQCIKLRTYIDDQDKINLKFNECIQYEHLLHHMNYVTPIVESCIEKVSNYKTEIDKAKEIIARFDEVILEKASKFSVDTIVEEMKQHIIKYENKLSTHTNDKVNKMKKIVEDLRSDFRNTKADCNKYALISITKVAKEVQDCIYDRLGGQPIDPIELQNRLSLKADK